MPFVYKDFVCGITQQTVLPSHWCNLVQYSCLPSSFQDLVCHTASLTEPVSYPQACKDPRCVEAMDK